MNSEGGAIYSRRVAELSKCQPEALCVCLVRFPGVCFSHARTCLYICMCVYSQNEKPLSRVSSAGHVYEGQEKTKDETSVSGNGSPGYDGNWLLLSSERKGGRSVRVNSRGRNTGWDVSRGNSSRNMSRVLEAFLSRVFPSSHFPPESSLKFVATE